MTLFDLRHAARYYGRRRGFAASAVLILAVGIGLNTVVFSAISAVMLRSLPFVGAERTVFVWESTPESERRSVSYPKLLDWARLAEPFEHLSGFANPTYTLSGRGFVERVDGELVSASYFPMLGVAADRGRTFVAEEGTEPGAARVALLADSLWRRRFGSDPGIVGSTVTVNGARVRVVGVLPERFRGITGSAELWMPLAAQELAIPELESLEPMERRDVRWLAVLGRLEPGVAPEQARERMEALERQLAPLDPETDADGGVRLIPLRDQLFGDLEGPLLLLQGAVFFVLLVACANLTNLLLARLVARERELSVRLALGATRRELIGQLAAESFVLAAAGAVLGSTFAFGTIRLLDRALAGQVPSYVALRLDPTVLGFTLLCTVGCALAITAVSAWRHSAPAVSSSLSESGPSTSEGRASRRTRQGLVVGEVALSVALLLTAGLMGSAFRRSQQIDPGFAVDDRAVFRIDLPAARYGPNEIHPFAERLLSAIDGLPSVRRSAISSDLPFGDRESAAYLVVEGRSEASEDTGIKVYRHAVSAGYFETLGIPILRGRGFRPSDRRDTPAVAMVSTSAARKLWPDSEPIGRRFRIGTRPGSPWVRVVGVVEEVRYRDLFASEQDAPDIFVPFSQTPARSFALISHTVGDPRDLVPALRETVQSLDPEIPLYAVSTLREHVRDSVAALRLASIWMGIFGIAALLLASFGLYSVISYTTRQRKREMGIRLAFGADRPGLVRLVVRHGMTSVLAGLAAGTLLGLLAARGMAASTPGIGEVDPAVLASTLLVLFVTSLAATYLPARRIARTDPVEVLRGE